MTVVTASEFPFKLYLLPILKNARNTPKSNPHVSICQYSPWLPILPQGIGCLPGFCCNCCCNCYLNAVEQQRNMLHNLSPDQGVRPQAVALAAAAGGVGAVEAAWLQLGLQRTQASFTWGLSRLLWQWMEENCCSQLDVEASYSINTMLLISRYISWIG